MHELVRALSAAVAVQGGGDVPPHGGGVEQRAGWKVAGGSGPFDGPGLFFSQGGSKPGADFGLPLGGWDVELDISVSDCGC
jgi:hypothetical protein